MVISKIIKSLCVLRWDLSTNFKGASPKTLSLSKWIININLHLTLTTKVKIMRKWSLLLISSLAVIAGCYIYFHQTRHIETFIVDVQKNTSKMKLDFPYIVSSSAKDMNHVLFEWLGDSLDMKSNMSFQENDYLVTFGRSLKEARYYQHMHHPNDDCDYLPNIPLEVSYQNNHTDSIYFYKIEKGRYRDLCGP
jgi:hypothetical protein